MPKDRNGNDMHPCPDCGELRGIGSWPICQDSSGKHGHNRPSGMHTFVPYWDEHIDDNGKPVFITSWAEKQKLLKPHWRDDYLIQTRERGELSRRNWRR